MKNQDQLKRGKRRDEIGRLDHERTCDTRQKSKHDWLSEYETDLEDYEKDFVDLVDQQMDRE